MSFRKRVRYRFDNMMSRGVGSQILLLAIITAILVVLAGVAIQVLGAGSEETQSESFRGGLWRSLMHMFDPGTLGGNSEAATATFLFIMLIVTLGGLFVLSALIGVLNQGFGNMIESLRRGRSPVMEENHTVILGWTPKIHTLLGELAEANANQRGACVVILADRDKVEMDAEVAPTVKSKHLRVVTRSGNPMSTADLELVALPTSKSVIALAPELHANGEPMQPHESDTVVLKSLLAIAKAAPQHKLHVVAEIFDERTADVARMVAGEKAALILAAPLISRLLVQTGRQSGLSIVYTELLDFAGNEIYVLPEPKLAGTTFREATMKYDTSALIGVFTRDGETLVPPPFDRKFVEGDHVIAISEDDDTVILDGAPPTIDEKRIVPRPDSEAATPERTLVLGASNRLATVLHELDQYVAKGSETLVVAESIPEVPHLDNMTVTTRAGDLTDRGVLESLDVTSFDHVLVLSEVGGRTQEMADARTTVTLLHLRDIERGKGKKVPITSEILDINNRDLASVAEADDFIVSNTLVSLMVSQVSENPHLVKVFEELFAPEGYEIYLKPADHYVRAGEHPWGEVCEAALRHQEIAIGYRTIARASDPAASYGVAINPAKRSTVKLTAADKIIVLAEH